MASDGKPRDPAGAWRLRLYAWLAPFGRLLGHARRTEQAFVVVVAVIVGVLAAGGAVGFRWKEGTDPNVLRALKVREVFDGNSVRLLPALPLRAVLQRALSADRDTFFVLGRDESYLGCFTLNDLRGVIAEQELPDFIVAADLVRDESPAVLPTDSLDLVMHLFGRHDVDAVAVLSPDGKRRLLGSVRHKDVIDAYNRQMFRLASTSRARARWSIGRACSRTATTCSSRGTACWCSPAWRTSAASGPTCRKNRSFRVR